MKYVLFSAMALFAILILKTACSGPVTKFSANPDDCCAKTREVLLFIDMEVDRPGQPGYAENLERLNSILFPLEDAYMTANRICPFNLQIYPLYYGTSKRYKIYSFRMQNFEQSCVLSAVERDEIRMSFSPISAYQSFYEKHLKGKQERYKSIWPSVRHIADAVAHSKADELIILYYSNFLEFRGPNNLEAGLFSFVTHNKNNPMAKPVLNCTFIEETQKSLTMMESPVRNMLLQCRKVLGDTTSDKQVSLYLIARDLEGIKSDNCSKPDLLEQYWISFFNTAGIKNLRGISLSDLQDVLN